MRKINDYYSRKAKKDKYPARSIYKLEDQKTKDYRKYFWGAWDAYRVKLAVGRDIVLNPVQAGQPLNTFGYPYAEIGGKSLDWLDPATFKYTISYHK